MEPMKIPALIPAILLLLIHPLGAQSTPGTVLPHTALKGSAQLRVAVPETIGEVVLESRPKGAKAWAAEKKGVVNLPGGTEVLVNVPPALRNRELRVRVRSVRTAPQAVAHTRIKANTSMQIAAGLAAGTQVSAEYFDSVAKQWKRFSTATAPADIKKPWSIPVPKERRAAQWRATRLNSTTPGTRSARFPAAFRTGKTKFSGREVPASSSNTLVGESSLLASMDKSQDQSPGESTIEESDIWKTSGTRVFFFNQLRGLQVIETANPSEPEIVSFLRMPAVGEDMYVLPGSRAVLVRRDWMNGGTTGIVLVDASKPQARILAELPLQGWYVDSRMVDGRLVVATSEWDAQTWQTTTRLSVVENLSASPRVAASRVLGLRAWAMGAGGRHLWIAGTKGWSWDRSTVAVFRTADLANPGEPLQIDLSGVVYDKFKIHIDGDTLFAIVQSWTANWRQSTAMESHSIADAKLLQRLPLIEGESLHATRFDGKRAYVVTFEQVDPLWIVDLSNPSAMHIDAELEVPGWSTYIQPVGGFLAAVGVENGKVTASLFDVRDPKNPSLSSRVEIGDGGYSWSEANWNEKAAAILPEAGLILLPYSSFNSEGHVSAVQLVDMNTATGSLVKRGVVRHAFTPRRASALREGILVSLSNRELFLLDSSNRDKPAVLAEVSLAFGADRILGTRSGFLVHAESGDWSGSSAVLRVSDSLDPDSVLAQAPLGEGEILSATLRGRHIVVLLKSRKNSSAGTLVHLDATKLPALVEIGRCALQWSAGWNAKVELVWPADDLVVAASIWKTWNWWRGPWDDVIALPAVAPRKSVVSDMAIWPPLRHGDEAAVLNSFDLSGTAPKLASTLDLSSIKPRNLSAFFAADGLVLFSSDSAELEIAKPGKPSATPRTLDHSKFRVVDYADPANPFFWPEAALPGRLEGITEFDRTAGLLYASDSAGLLQALFYEAGMANALASLPVGGLRAASGRSVWSFDGGQLSRHRLSDAGVFVSEGTRKDVPVAPTALRALPAGLLAQNGADLLHVPQDFSAAVKKLSMPGWTWWWSRDLSLVHAEGGFFAAPAGEYGIEIAR